MQLASQKSSHVSLLMQTTIEHFPTLEFEEFQTNPITRDVQDATTTETEREVQRTYLHCEFARGLSRVRTRVLVRTCGRHYHVYHVRVRTYLRLHMRSICTAQARVCRASTVYRASCYEFLVEFSVSFPPQERSNDRIRSRQLP